MKKKVAKYYIKLCLPSTVLWPYV